MSGPVLTSNQAWILGQSQLDEGGNRYLITIPRYECDLEDLVELGMLVVDSSMPMPEGVRWYDLTPEGMAWFQKARPNG